MLHASTQKLIVKIAELTEAGAIAWKEGEAARPCSVFESEGYVIEVTADPPTVRLLHADGREVERADAAELAGTSWPGGGGTFATQVAAMAYRARRVARGAEAAISRILSSLSAPPQKMPEAEPSPAAPEFETAPVAPPAPLSRSHSAPEEAPAPARLPEPPARPAIEIAPLSSTVPAAPPRAMQAPVFRPDPQLSPQPQAQFGAMTSFSRAPPAPAPDPAPAKVTSGGLLFTGIRAVTQQTIHGEIPAPPPPARPAPPPEPKPEPPHAPATGPGVYKPWA
jgi:hypothetical protein